MPETAAQAASQASVLAPILVFCAAAVLAVPLAHWARLSPVLGYLVAGILIGPSALALTGDSDFVRTIAELGVVLLLFLVGLQLKIERLISLRADIFGLGFAQVLATTLVIAGICHWVGLDWPGALLIGMGFSLSATAMALQALEEQGELDGPLGQRTFSVLLFQDIATVPLLAAAPIVASIVAGSGGMSLDASLIGVAKAIGAMALVVLVGRYLLNPLFRLLATSGAREVMTAAALLVVLGAGLVMDRAGLSMAMGAFLAGLLLAESNFRHQLEADIEPFRGLLLGLFFMSVGMSVDLALVRSNLVLILALAFGVVLAKTIIAALLARSFGSRTEDSWRIGALLSPAGEFTFVVVPLTATLGLVGGEAGRIALAVAAITMLIGPVMLMAVEFLRERFAPADRLATMDESFDGAGGAVLVIGFGRFGQVVNQVLLAESHDVTVIDRDVSRIKSAASFGFKVYFGDGTRLDVLRAAGGESAGVICICVDDREAALRIVEIASEHFPQARLHARAYDRIHAIDLANAGVDVHMRETFESALSFGRATLVALGTNEKRALDVMDDVRRRDVARLVMQQADGILGGMDLLHGTPVTPQPLTEPKARSRALNEETRAILGPAEPATPAKGEPSS